MSRTDWDEQFLLTADKGFGDIRIYPPGTPWGYPIIAA